MNSLQRLPISVLLLGFAVSFVYAGGEEEKISRTGFYFDSTCTVSLYGNDGENIFLEVFKMMEELDQKLNPYTPGSEISIQNQQAGLGPTAVSDELFSVVKHGVAYSRLTSGAFDITIGPLVMLWREAKESSRMPLPVDIQGAIASIGYEKVMLFESDKRVLLEERGMMLDSGGIGIGYAADAVAQYIRNQGHERALIDFGGNIVAIGTRSEGTPWRIAIQHPDQPRGESIALIEISDRAAATSGKSKWFLDDGTMRYHHILDTETGYPVDNDIDSVTIVTDSSLKADALSTAVFALGAVEGLELVTGFDGVEAVIVMESKTIHVTDGIAESFLLIDSNYSVLE